MSANKPGKGKKQQRVDEKGRKQQHDLQIMLKNKKMIYKEETRPPVHTN